MGKSHKKRGGAEPAKMIIDGKEWCECKPELSTAEKAKEIGANAEQKVKDVQANVIDTITNKGKEFGDNLSNTLKNAANKALGNNDKIVTDAQPTANAEPTAEPVVQQGGRRHTHKHCSKKHCHSKHKKHCHSNHKHSKKCNRKRKTQKRKTQKRKH
jgi:hypothetical protein